MKFRIQRNIVVLSISLVLAVGMVLFPACWLFPFANSPTDDPEPTTERDVIQMPQSEGLPIERGYEWNDINSNHGALSIAIGQNLYDYYTERPRPPTMDYSVYVTHIGDDQHIHYIATQIKMQAENNGLGYEDTLNFVASFVQELEYEEDDVGEYPQYPLETLLKTTPGGDCEDKSILLAAIAQDMGYDVALLSFSDHMAVGVAGNFSGTFYSSEGKNYYYLETTGCNYTVGVFPPEIELGESSDPTDISKITPISVLTQEDSEYRLKGNDLTVTTSVINLGTAEAKNSFVRICFEDEDKQVYQHGTSDSDHFNVDPDFKISPITIHTTLPEGKYKLLIQVIDNNIVASESVSEEWLEWP